MKAGGTSHESLRAPECCSSKTRNLSCVCRMREDQGARTGHDITALLETIRADHRNRETTQMTTRTSRKTVTFTHPFQLNGMDEVQPAGTYMIETDEELIEGLSFLSYRRTGTFILLPSRSNGSASGQVITINPWELEAAQEMDARSRMAGLNPGPSGASAVTGVPLS
jgi:hypothetical protein